MSKGLGKTQRAILKLIAAHADEAWPIEDLCRSIYQTDLRPTRAQTNAVVRALMMPLPARWRFGYVGRDRRRWLYDAGNLKAVTERMYRLETFVLKVEVDPRMELPANLSDVGTEITLSDLSDMETTIVLTGLPTDREH
jgi:hypothetical protein